MDDERVSKSVADERARQPRIRRRRKLLKGKRWLADGRESVRRRVSGFERRVVAKLKRHSLSTASNRGVRSSFRSISSSLAA